MNDMKKIPRRAGFFIRFQFACQQLLLFGYFINNELLQYNFTPILLRFSAQKECSVQGISGTKTF